MRRNTPKPLQFKTVAEAMKALGLKDADLAQEIGCDRTWITKLRGGQKIIGLARPLKIARRLNVPIENLAATDAA